jgi:ribosomal protein S27AE
MRTCPRCEIEKPDEDFIPGRRACRDCERERKRLDYHLHAEARKAKQRAWKQAHPEQVAEQSRRWKEENAEHVREYHREYVARRLRDDPDFRKRHEARVAVSNALKTGRLVRPDRCEQCGEAGKLQAHHEDHGRPLDVEWLCGECHLAIPR